MPRNASANASRMRAKSSPSDSGLAKTSRWLTSWRMSGGLGREDVQILAMPGKPLISDSFRHCAPCQNAVSSISKPTMVEPSAEILFARLPPKARVIFLNSYLQPENGHADVFIPISVATERAGHYTNFQGTVSAFEPCFARPAGVADAATVFAAIAVAEGVQA